MPYIPQKERDELDPLIDALVTRIKTLPGKNPTQPLLDFAGRINYVATQIILKLVEPYRGYWAIALMCGVVDNIRSEFYLRYATPYEIEKIVQNGDIEGLGHRPVKGSTGL
jgi:hypothetical protein